MLDFLFRGILLRRSVFARLQGLSYAARSGSRGIVAGWKPLSNADEARELPFSRLQDGALERGRIVSGPLDRGAFFVN